MKLEKVNNTYNTYKVELSYSQLLAFRDGLKARHASPESDEALKEIDWYLASLPRPGEEKDKEGNHTDPTRVSPGGPLDDIDLDRDLPEPDADEEIAREVEGESDELEAPPEGDEEPMAELPEEDEELVAPPE